MEYITGTIIAFYDRSDPNITRTLNELLYSHKDTGYGSDKACADVRNVVDLSRLEITALGRYVVIALAGFHLAKEIFQFIQVSADEKSIRQVGREVLSEKSFEVSSLKIRVQKKICCGFVKFS